MSNILILGGTGYTGKLIARHLLEHSTAKVTLATRHPDRAGAFAEELNASYAEPRATAVYADAADGESLRAAFQDQDFVVVAAPTTAYAETVIRAALETGVDYLDVQVDAQKLALLQSLADEIEGAGRIFITEAGFHPGLPSALVRYAAAHLDTIEHAVTAGYLNMGKDLPYSEAVDEVVGMFKDYQGQVYKNGQWTKPSAVQMRTVDFGGEIGKKRCYAMFFEELRALPEHYPALQDLGFYISETHWMTDWVIMSIAWVWLKLMPFAVRPIGKFLWWGMQTFHKPPYRVELQVQATGRKYGQPAAVQASVMHTDGYALTAIPVVATLLHYLDGPARAPGLWMMGHFAEPVRLMQDMEKMGVQITTRIRCGSRAGGEVRQGGVSALLERRFDGLLAHLKRLDWQVDGDTRDAVLGEVRDLVAHGEPGVALEILCQYLYEYAVPIDRRALKTIRFLAAVMQMPASTWDFLGDPCR